MTMFGCKVQHGQCKWTINPSSIRLQIYLIIQDGLHNIFPADQLVPGEDNDLDEQTHPDVPHKVSLRAVKDLPSNQQHYAKTLLGQPEIYDVQGGSGFVKVPLG